MKVLLFSVLLSFNLFGQASNVLVLSTDVPEAGQTIEVLYSGRLTTTTSKMFAVLYKSSFIDTDTKAIPFYFKNGKLAGNLTLPKSTIFFVIKVVNGSEIDNNEGNGYGFNIFKNGEVVPKSFFAEGYFNYQNTFLFDGKSNPEHASQLMEKEFAINPQLKKELRPYYLRALYQIPDKKLEAMTIAKQQLDNILENGVDELNSVIYAYIISGNNRQVMDSLVTLVSKTYPYGAADFSRNLKLLQKASTDELDMAVKQYRKITNDFQELTLIQARLLFSEMLWIYAVKYEQHEIEKNIFWLLNQEKSPETYSYIAAKFREIAYEFSKKDSTLSQAKEYAENSLWASKQSDTLSINYARGLDIYAQILFKQGKLNLALKNQREAVDLMGNTNEMMNERYVNYLFSNKKYRELTKVTQLYYELKVSTPKIDSLYRTAVQFLSVNGKNENVEIISQNTEKDFRQSIQDNLVNVPAPCFSLKNLKGEIVELSNYKGKILVLDFWATWCGPCIKSFPAMKEIINEQKDGSVEFLFINTFEDQVLMGKGGKTVTERIKSLLDKRGLNDFNVGIDILENNLNLTAKNYNVTSIPAKIVIDKSGNIRYRSTGFSSDDKLKRELKTVIELIK